MKNLIYLFCLVICCACGSLPQLTVIYPNESLYGIDFTPYTQKGFLMTPEKYSGPYESVGMINFTAKPGAQYKLTERKPNPYYSKGSGEPIYIEIYEWKIDSISFSQVLDRVYKICLDMGADALVNFQNEIVLDPHSGISNPVTITGYRITGFAIKRKQ